MTPHTTVLLAALTGLVGYIILSRVLCWHRLRHVPGPFWARWGHFWLVRRIYTGNYITRLHQLHQTHGPVVCLAPDLVSVSDPDEIRRINAVRSVWGRGTPYLGFRTAPGVDSLFSMRDRRGHERLRAKLIAGYTGKAVEGVHDMIDDHVRSLVSLIRDKYVTTPEQYRPVDFSRLTMYFVTDVISCFAFGTCFGCLERDGDFHEYLETVGTIAPAMVSACVLPFFQGVMSSPALGRFMPEGSFLKPVLDVARGAVAERFGEKKIQRKDVLGSFVAHGLSQSECEVETTGQLAAGGDTTATAIRATMLFLLSSPQAYHKLQREIDEAVKSGRISASPVPDAEANELVYLQAVIKEGLRIFPPVAMMPRISDSEEMVCGVRIPKGVNVETSVKTALRNKSIFGNDADTFRPERWLEADLDRLKVMEETHKFV